MVFKKPISKRNENKTKVKMNKPVYLRLSILEISKTLMYEFWCDFIKPKYQDNVKFYMDTYKQKIFVRTLQMMLKKGLMHQIMSATDHYLQEKIKK